MRAPTVVDTQRSRLSLALALTMAALVAAPPTHAAVPLPHPHVPPPIKAVPHALPEPRPPARDLLPEPLPSNDPNVYETPELGSAPGRAVTGAAESVNDDSGGGSTDVGALPGGGSDYEGDDDEGGLDLGSIGVVGAVLMSGGSLAMWLRRRR